MDLIQRSRPDKNTFAAKRYMVLTEGRNREESQRQKILQQFSSLQATMDINMATKMDTMRMDILDIQEKALQEI